MLKDIDFVCYIHTYVRVCTSIFPLFEHTLLATYIVAGHGKMKIDDVFHHRVQRVHFRCNCSAFKHKCRRKVQSESTVNNSEWVFESQCECVRQLIISVKWSTRNAAKAQLQIVARLVLARPKLWPTCRFTLSSICI